MTHRQQVLDAIRVAAYQGDMAEATRLYVENRISWKAFQKAVQIGRQQRETNTFKPAN